MVHPSLQRGRYSIPPHHPPSQYQPNAHNLSSYGRTFNVYPLVTVYQVMGAPGSFSVQITPNYHALNDPNRLDRVAVTYGMTDMELGFAELGVAATPVDNNDERYSNQWWVLDALANLYDQRFFSEAVFDETIGILLQLKQGVDPEDLILQGSQNDLDSSDEDDSDDDVPELEL